MGKAALAVVNIGQLVTMAGPARPRVDAEMRELGLLQDAVLLVAKGRVARVGSWTELRADVDAATQVVDAGGALVTPGFVDAHTHLVFGGNRAQEFEQRIGGATYQEIAAAGGGIQSTVNATRRATEDELLAAARRHRNWLVRSGVTTLEAKTGYGLDDASERKTLRVMARLNAEGPVRVVPTLLAAHTVPREFRERREEYVRWVAEELIPEVAAAGLAKYCDAFCDDHAFRVDEVRTVFASAQRHGLKLRAHVEQFRSGTGADLAAEMGAVTADHLEAVTDESLMRLKAAGTMPVLLPASVFCLGREQYPPARRMIELGMPVVLATDFNPGSAPAANMPMTMTLACLAMKMLPAEALTAVTVNAAHSLGLGDEIGTLEVGRRADFVVHECGDYRELAYFAAAPMLRRVFVGGAEVSL